jgi:hypothetical protein
VKPTVLLVAAGLAISVCALNAPVLLGLVAGFAAVAGADVLLIGRAGITQTLRASGMVSVGSPWRGVRALLSLFVSSSVADEVVRWCAVALAVFLAMRLLRPSGDSFPFVPDFRRYSGGNTEQIASAGFALGFAWLFAWPYVLPWYDALAWALLPLLPASGLDWLLLARTAVLGFGYLPARSAGITIPGGLRWMEPVMRSAITPVMLAFLLVTLILWTARSDGYSAHRDSHRDLYRWRGSRGDRRGDRAGRAPADRPRRA